MTTRPLTVLYVSDSSTVSGAESVLLGHLAHFRPPHFRAHVALRGSNVRLIEELRRRGISHSIIRTFSRSPIRTTPNPASLAHFTMSIARTGYSLAGIIRRHEVDLVHSVMYPAALYVAVASRLTSCRQVWHEHGIKRVHRVNRQIYRWVGVTCCRVIGPSQAVVRPLLEAGLDQASVKAVYNGIDLKAFDPCSVDVAAARRSLQLRDGERAVGLFGQMLPHKGHVTLIEAAPAILRECPAVKFFLVGALENPVYQEALGERLERDDLARHFVFTGWRQDVPALIAAMDAVVVPTLTPEPAALTLMESMALARPLIASRTGGTIELVVDGETALLFEPGNAPALARLVLTVLGDANLADRLGRGGRARMETDFSLERHLQEIESIYRECATRPCRTAAR